MILIIKIILLDNRAEYFSRLQIFLYALFFKNTLRITTHIKVVNIQAHNAQTNKNIHWDLPNAMSSKNILQAKLQGANHAKNAIHKLEFSVLWLWDEFLLIAFINK